MTGRGAEIPRGRLCALMTNRTNRDRTVLDPGSCLAGRPALGLDPAGCLANTLAKSNRIRHMHTIVSTRAAAWLVALLFWMASGTLPAAQTSNLFQGMFQDLVQRYPVGDPLASNPIANTEGPKTLAAGDMDGDGRADVIAGNLDGSISVLLSKPDGWGLSPQVLLPATNLLRGASLRAVVVADFDNDGRPDVAAGDIAGQGVVMLLGNGDGSLRELGRTPIGPVRSMAAGDFDHDGHADLLVACGGPECDGCSTCGTNEWRFLCILPGVGDGTFGPAQYLFSQGVEACFYDVAVADLNQDGHLDALALDYARTPSYHKRICVFTNDGTGGFATDQPAQTLEISGLGPRSFAVGYIDERLTNSIPPPGATLDVVVACRDSRALEVFLNRGDLAFDPPVQVPVGNTPRDVVVGDLDGDGLSDLVVVNRNLNSIAVLRGQGSAQFNAPMAEYPTGNSPRQVVLADFDGDGVLDAAVNNRSSQDISIFKGQKGESGFLISQAFYPSGYTPDSIVAQDFNGDGRPDLAIANLRSHDVRVRFNQGDGSFGPETVYPVNYSPVSLAVGDFNGDGVPDLAVTCLGATPPTSPNEKPALVTLLGRPSGAFQPPVATSLGESASRPYVLRLGDLDGDGRLDAAVGTTDGALVVFRGRGDGTFDRGLPIGLLADGRPVGFALGDFNQDGRLDIACSRGQVFLNDGGFFAETNAMNVNDVWNGPVTTFQSGVQAWRVEADDLDGDGHLDLMVALTWERPDPIAVFYGGGDGTFDEWHLYEGPDIGAVAIYARDMDGDGIKDLVIGNRCAATVEILRGSGGRVFALTNREIILTPSVEDLAVADLNGDGRPDLVGVGIGVWPLLSGAATTLSSPRQLAMGGMAERQGLYLNEVMTRNKDFYLRGGVTPDWIELYNHNTNAQDLTGWAVWEITGDNHTNRYSFPSELTIPAWSHLVVFFSDSSNVVALEGPVLTGNLSADGQTLVLIGPDGAEADRVTVPGLPIDVSYARFADGARFFSYNSAPTMGTPNQRPGNLEPTLERKQPYVAPGGGALALTARVFDDVAVAFVAAGYRLAGGTTFTEVALSDDGAHGDKLAGDGYWGGFVTNVLPGATLEFYFRAVDLEGTTVSAPGNLDDPAALYRLAVPVPGSAIRITELVADNQTGLRDEKGQYEDWLELLNTSSNSVSLSGWALTKDIFASPNQHWRFPNGSTLAPGARLVVFCDEDSKQGPFHADFRLTKDGDRVFLVRTNNPILILDSLSFVNLPTDVSCGVLGQATHTQLFLFPTPGLENIPSPAPRAPGLPGPEIWTYLPPETLNLVLRWTAPTNLVFDLQASEDMRSWTPVVPAPRHLGSGVFGCKDPYSVRYGNRFFRLVGTPAPGTSLP